MRGLSSGKFCLPRSSARPLARALPFVEVGLGAGAEARRAPAAHEIGDDRHGETVNLAERVDGVRFGVVVFLSPTCRACIDDAPILNALAERRRDARFVAVIEDADGFDFAADLSPTLHVVVDRDRRLQSAFDVRGFPYAVVVDSDGRIAANAIAGVRDIESRLQVIRRVAEDTPARPEDDPAATSQHAQKADSGRSRDARRGPGSRS